MGDHGNVYVSHEITDNQYPVLILDPAAETIGLSHSRRGRGEVTAESAEENALVRPMGFAQFITLSPLALGEWFGCNH